MKTVFADTQYWIAIVCPNDQWNLQATKACKELGDVILVTTDEVLTESVAALSKNPPLRKAAMQAVRRILKNPNVKVARKHARVFCGVLIASRIATTSSTA